MSPVAECMLELAAAARPLARQLKQIGRRPVALEHVTAPAQAFAAALVLRAVKRRVWVLCANVRSQEQLHGELLNFCPDALFFPEMEMAAVEGALPDPEIAAERLGVLQKFSAPGAAMLLTAAALDSPVPAPGSLDAMEMQLAPGDRIDLDSLVGQFARAGYERVGQVGDRGQFAVRGGILDVFSWQHPAPVRVELFDDRVDSLREFDIDQQISVQRLDSATLLLGEPEERTAPLREHLRDGDLVLAIEIDLAQGASPILANARFPGGSASSPDLFPARSGRESDPPEARSGRESDPPEALQLSEMLCPRAQITITDGGADEENYDAAFYDHGLGDFDAGDLVLREASRERLLRQLAEWRDAEWTTVIYCNNEGEEERFRDLLAGPDAVLDSVRFAIGSLSRGFIFPAAKLAVLADSELLGRYRAPSARRLAERRARLASSRAQVDFSELTEGDPVVHLEHGIALFNGLKTLPDGELGQEVLELEFAAGAKLYVPVEHSYLVSRYVGVGRKHPPLNALGDARWGRAKRNAERAVADYAAMLLGLQAERQSARGHAFEPDGRWQREFEQSFLYRETPDQIRSIHVTKSDMESTRPMDRLICGDVGFGKTEVAIRAAFKAVMGGKQVAMLVPTTVLAQQHHQTFRERMSDYPLRVEMLSRFRTRAEQRAVLEGLRTGAVDIVIGTHRLISGDVEFKDLGLVVVDEEQRFGVLHKERLKSKFKLVDVLTLSATPIPRTLYLSLLGARDMSVIETPPANRLPVETIICGYDERVIRDAILREMDRQGQVYFLHNRVRTIERVRDRVRLLCPDARVDIGHGQMPEDELEDVMARFVRGDTDVLISTTIIESGLDIPNANTILIDRADRFGLADLYQLRGRVGRAQHKAYAYFLLPRDLVAAGAARKRINAIKQHSSLGAGFKIAMRDLEIRGAGNILGTAQSGHIINVGFDLYCSLLRQAVAKLKGESSPARMDVPVDLDFVAATETGYGGKPGSAGAYLPSGYIPDAAMRMAAYRRVAETASAAEVEALRESWKDRFGTPPQTAENLLALAEIRALAGLKKIERVSAREGKLMLLRGGDYVLLEGRFPRLTAPTPDRNVRQVLEFIRRF